MSSRATVQLIFPARPKSGRWDEREYESLLLHEELLGPQWFLIAESMGRKQSSIFNKLRQEKARKSTPTPLRDVHDHTHS